MTLIHLGRRVGNWFTASSGDAEFLAMSELDELTILTRGGSVDMDRFNKRWGQELRTLMDSEAQVIEGPEVEEALGRLSKFTAYMTCIVAVLDGLADEKTARRTLRLLLKLLLRTTEKGEDLIDAEFNNRLNAWRSNAKVRGLALECQSIREELIKDQILQSGYIPVGDEERIAKALYWLLAENTDQHVTPSIDVVGIMICLERLGFDIIGVEGPGLYPDPPERACRVIYSPHAIVGTDIAKWRNRVAHILIRSPSTIVSLQKPHESLTTFPIDGTTAERCRQAWKAGRASARYLKIQVDIPDSRRIRNACDFHYHVINCGTEPTRTDEGIFQLAFAHALVINQELCQNLQNVMIEPEDVLNWIYGQTTTPPSTSPLILHYHKLERRLMDAFTVFQAFFMGYYYAVFLSLVDTSALQMPTVDGRWGYCSADFLILMRSYCKTTPQKGLSRQEVIQILSQLLFSHKIAFPNTAREQWCLGVVDKRTLLVQSLLGICRTPQDIGRFVLLDVDVGGIPTVHGLVLPGIPDARAFVSHMVPTIGAKEVQEQGPEVDFTVHIEADWYGNPDNILLCFRYKGRRVASVNPSCADLLFCYAYVDPVKRITEGPQWTNAPTVECNLSDFQQGRTPSKEVSSKSQDVITLVQVYGRPIMRYAALGFYSVSRLPGIKLASNCLHEAIRRVREAEPSEASCIVIAGEGPWKESQPFNLRLKQTFHH